MVGAVAPISRLYDRPCRHVGGIIPRVTIGDPPSQRSGRSLSRDYEHGRASLSRDRIWRRGQAIGARLAQRSGELCGSDQHASRCGGRLPTSRLPCTLSGLPPLQWAGRGYANLAAVRDWLRRHWSCRHVAARGTIYYVAAFAGARACRVLARSTRSRANRPRNWSLRRGPRLGMDLFRTLARPPRLSARANANTIPRRNIIWLR